MKDKKPDRKKKDTITIRVTLSVSNFRGFKRFVKTFGEVKHPWYRSAYMAKLFSEGFAKVGDYESFIKSGGLEFIFNATPVLHGERDEDSDLLPEENVLPGGGTSLLTGIPEERSIVRDEENSLEEVDEVSSQKKNLPEQGTVEQAGEPKTVSPSGHSVLPGSSDRSADIDENKEVLKCFGDKLL